MIDEVDSESEEEEEEREWNEIDSNGKRQATPRDTNSKNKRNNNNNSNSNHKKDVEMNKQQGLVGILQINNHQSQQQRVSIVDERIAIGSGRGDRGGKKQRKNKHTKGNENWNSEPPPSPPE